MRPDKLFSDNQRTFNDHSVRPETVGLPPANFRFARDPLTIPASVRMLLGRVVIQVLPEPSLDFRHAHPLAFAVVGNLVAVDLAQTEIS
jgi:hypothetical protein